MEPSSRAEREAVATELLCELRGGASGPRLEQLIWSVHTPLTALVCLRFGIHDSDAEELASEAVEELYLRRLGIRDVGCAWSYLVTIAFRLARRWLLRLQPRATVTEVFEDREFSSRVIERIELSEAFLAFWRSLDDDLRQMIRLRCSDATVEEISMKIGLSPRTVQRRLQSVRERALGFFDLP